MELAQTILAYYIAQAEKLPPDKRFHLANRLASWTGDQRAARLLAEYRQWYVPAPLTDQTLAQSLQQAGSAANNTVAIRSYALRQPYFNRYPQLIPLEAELFRLRHWLVLYGVDARAAFLARHPIDSLLQLQTALLNDAEALRMTASWAVNFLYLLHIVVLGDDGPDPAIFYQLGDADNTQNDEQFRLLLYLYTHVIIASSNFYARPLPSAALPVYRQMLADLETLHGHRLARTSLDAKLEYLVCCRLVGYDSARGADIAAECGRSLSPDGSFIIDTHNVFSNDASRKTLEASEHRNVLFIMSQLPRRPSPLS